MNAVQGFDDDALERELATDIVWGAFPPSARLDINGICAMYGETPERCRAALDRMTRMGLIAVDAAGRMHVAPLTKEIARLQIQRSTDASLALVEEAARNIGEIDSTRLATLLSQLRMARAAEDRIFFGRLVWQIHTTVYAAAHDDARYAELELLDQAISRIQALVVKGSSDEMFVELHAAMVRAVASGDSEGLLSAFRVIWIRLSEVVESIPDADWPRGY